MRTFSMALSYTDKAKYWGDFPGHLLIQTESNLVSPKREWTKSIRSNVPIAASMLNFQDHFEMESIDDETWKEVVDHLSTYCRSVATTNDNVKMVLRIPETATAMMKKVSSGLSIMEELFPLVAIQCIFGGNVVG